MTVAKTPASNCMRILCNLPVHILFSSSCSAQHCVIDLWQVAMDASILRTYRHHGLYGCNNQQESTRSCS